MKAAVIHGLRDLRVETLPDPEPGPGEVVLAIDAALTCGTDVKAYHRGHPAYGRPPMVFGHEFAGRVAAVGEDVAGFAVGDRVFPSDSAPCGACFFCARRQFALCEDLEFCFGGFAELVRLPARLVRCNLHPLPDDLPTEIAALAEPLACAIKAVDHAGLDAGREVAVLGGGALGLMLTAVLADRGASVTVVDPHPERLALTPGFGASRTVRATRGHDDVEAVRRGVHGGRGPDHVFEAVGRVQSWELAVAMPRRGGAVHLFGGCPIGTTFAVPTARVHYEEVVVRGTFHHDPERIRAALAMLGRGDRPWGDLLGAEVGLDGLAAVLDGRLHAEALKVVVRP